MATWKKIIVSGSDAHLNQITSSIISSSDVIGTDILAQKYFISESGTRLADTFSGSIRLGDEDLNLEISASSLRISSSGGITASIVPQIANPPFILAQTNDDKIVKIPLGEIGSTGGGNTVNNNVIDNFTTCSDNTNIGLTVTTTATSEVETLIGEIIINDVGTDIGNDEFVNPAGGNFDPVSRNQFIFRAGTGYSSGSINAGDTVRIKNNASSIINGQSDLNHTTKILSIFPNNILAGGSTPFTSSIGANGFSQWNSTPNKLVGKADIGYSDFFSASLQDSLTAGHVYLEGQTYDQEDKNIPYRSGLTYFLFKITAQSSSTVEICLAEDLSVNDITSSGDLFFEASESLSANGVVTESVHNIHYYGYEEGPGTGSLFITASHIKVSGNLDVNDNVNIGGNLTFDGFTFSDGNILVTSGSTEFGTSSADTHKFTGSLFVTGNIKLDTNSKLIGTASFADFASQSLTAFTASYIDSSNIDGQVGFPYSGSDFIGSTGTPDAAVITGSLILQSGISASGNITASGTISASAVDAKSITGSLLGTASFAHTSSYISGSNVDGKVNSASFAITASYINANNIDGQVGFPFTGSAHISGTLSLDHNGLEGGGLTSSITLNNITGKISSSGDIEAKNITASGNLLVHGNLLVSGTQTTLHTQDLIIEDRFIVIGSGSSAEANLDVGIVFDSGSVDGVGMGLFYDNSANRLAIGTSITDALLSNTSNTNYQVGKANFPGEAPLPLGDVAGNIMTIRSTGSIGVGQTDPIPAAKDVKLGKGEMLIDEDDNIWMYVGS